MENMTRYKIVEIYNTNVIQSVVLREHTHTHARGCRGCDHMVVGFTTTYAMKTEEQRNGVSSDQKGQSSSTENRMLLVLFISLVLDLLSFTLILPLLPSLLDY
jgi:hypothetical protein